MRQAVKRTWDTSRKSVLRIPTRTIPLGKRFWPLADEEKHEIDGFL